MPTVEVLPGTFARAIHQEGQCSAVGVFQWSPQGNGTFRPVLKVHPGEVRAETLAALVGLAFANLQALFHRRFVSGSQPSPGTLLIDFEDYLRHQEAARLPGFWTAARRRQLRDALAGTARRTRRKVF